MYQNLRQAGAAAGEGTVLPTGLQVGLGVRAAATARTFTQGALTQTGNVYDLAIQGKGFFQVQMPDGTVGYTRDGALQVNGEGQLVTSGGDPVQPPVTIPVNAQNVTIAKDGTVSVVLPGQAGATVIGQLQTADFVNPAGLMPMGGNLYAETAASGAPNVGAPNADGRGALQQGMLEGSNVNVVEELVTMIATQRAYELNSKAISTSDQMLQRLSQL
jgi:flagellar basal-body rod protein FlgG